MNELVIDPSSVPSAVPGNNYQFQALNAGLPVTLDSGASWTSSGYGTFSPTPGSPDYMIYESSPKDAAHRVTIKATYSGNTAECIMVFGR